MDLRAWNAFWEVVCLPALAVRRSTIEQYVDLTHGTIDWPGLTKAMKAWSYTEQVLLKSAHIVYDGGGNLLVKDLYRLDPDTWETIMGILERH